MGAEKLTYGSEGVRRRGIIVNVGPDGIGRVATEGVESTVRRRPGHYIGVEITGVVAGQVVWRAPNVPGNRWQAPTSYFRRVELDVADAEAAVRRSQADLGVLPGLRLVRHDETGSDTETVPDNVINAAGQFERRRVQALRPTYINVLK